MWGNFRSRQLPVCLAKANYSLVLIRDINVAVIEKSHFVALNLMPLPEWIIGNFAT
jgi:hypothetical protein